MAQLSLYYPIRPHAVSRAWGAIGSKKHNGIDIEITENHEVRSPIEGIVTFSGHHKGSAGVFLSIVSATPSDFPDGKRAYVELTFLHLSATLVEDGARVSVGTPIARSERGHVHLAPKRVRKGLFGFRDLDRNDADNTFDLDPYWNGRYA